MRFKLLAFALVAVCGIAIASAALSSVTVDDAVRHVKIRSVLLEHFGTDALGIRIDVNGGNVVLFGSVDKPSTQELAKQAALTVGGVTSVENRIAVHGAPLTRASQAAERTENKLEDALLEAKVKGRLLEQVGENALKIEVEVSDGVVSLRGEVPTENIKATALDTVKHTGGVRRVVNQVKAG